MTIRDKAYRDLCKEFSDAAASLRRKQRWTIFVFIINAISFVLNMLCIYMNFRG